MEIGCILCGAPVGVGHVSWLSEFRAIYSHGHNWSEPHCSGVGLRKTLNSVNLSVPSEYDMRYDDTSYQKSTRVKVRCMNPVFHTSMSSASFEQSEDSFRGFFFHDVC